MRIVYVVHGYPPDDLGGTEIHTAAVARALAGHGHDVWVFTGASGNASCIRVEHGVTVHRVGGRDRRLATPALTDAGIRTAFEALLDDVAPDLVHVQHLHGLSADLLDATARRAIPTVLTVHDQWFRCPSVHPRPQDRHRPGARSGIACLWHHDLRRPARLARHALRGTLFSELTGTLRRPRLLSQTLDLADVVIAPSRFIEDALIRDGVARHRIQVVPHGIDVVPPLGPREPRSPIRFGFVGAIVPTKGVQQLCDAFARTSGASTLHLFGPVSGEGTFRRVRRALGERIRYEGTFSPQHAAAVYGRIDVLVQPSLVAESFGLAAAEAHAAGIPVIASDTGALRERVRHDHDGLLVPPGDVGALARAISSLKDPDRVRALAANIPPPRDTATAARDLFALYRSLTARRIATGGRHHG